MINIFFRVSDSTSKLMKFSLEDINIYLNYHLDLGVILDGDVFNENRLLLLKEIKNPYNHKNTISLDNLKNDYITKLEYTIDCIKKDKKFCVWIDETAASLCGLLYINHLLVDYEFDLFVNTDKKKIVLSKTVLYDMDKLTKSQKSGLEKVWNDLIKDDGILRVFEKNTICTKSINYYDSLILNTIGHDDILQNDLNNIFREMQLPVIFLNNRINYLITKGKVSIVKDAEIIHNRIIRA